MAKGGGGGAGGSGGRSGGGQAASVTPSGTYTYTVRSGDQTLNLDIRDTPASAILDAIVAQGRSGSKIKVNLGSRGGTRMHPDFQREALRRAGLSGLAAAKAASQGSVTITIP